jgi:putative ABC transport system ATP-binding protein
VIRCIGVSKTYQDGRGRFNAVDRINLNIATGAFVVLAGPSGSGKTTLLNMIGGLDRATEGSIQFAGQDITQLSTAALAEVRLRKIGFVFQSYNLLPVLSAFENVEFVLRLQRVARAEREQRARAVLEEVGLERELDRRPSAMSGGQQQRVAVARALVTNPAVVLADEPTANLDSKTAAGLVDLMHHLNATRGTTFVVSTHDPMIIESAPRVVRLKDGQIISDTDSEVSARRLPPGQSALQWLTA